MLVKDIRRYEVEIFNQNDEELYSGNVDNAPEDLKKSKIDKIELSKKKLIIKI